jgi:GT2 family glycosyltransferase
LAAADAIAVVVVTYESADDLPRLAATLVPQLRDDDEVAIVDNSRTDATAATARELFPSAQVIETGENLGFAGGCVVGVEATRAPLVLLLNPDSQPAVDCLSRLREAASAHPQWGAWQALVLLEDGRINTSGNVIHYLGIGWAGNCNRSIAELPPGDREVTGPSGAAMVVRREDWRAIGGMSPEFFMYSEDLDLGLRLWLAGRRVGIAAAARVTHSYEFDKGPYKWFWMERNRWRMILSDYPAPLLALVAPALLAAELGLLAVAARQGWLRAKLRAQVATVADLPHTIARRRSVQRTRTISAAEFAGHLTASLDSPYLAAAHSPWLRVPQALYWKLVRVVLAALAR